MTLRDDLERAIADARNRVIADCLLNAGESVRKTLESGVPVVDLESWSIESADRLGDLRAVAAMWDSLERIKQRQFDAGDVPLHPTIRVMLVEIRRKARELL